MTIRTEKVEFPGSRGATLAARLERPEGEPMAYALFAHCFTCSKDVHAATRISRGLAERGIAALRFDFTGLGSSEGDFANTDFSSNVGDLVAAADVLRDRYAAPKLLVGHSLGGAAVLVAAEKIPESVAVATINAPCDPGHVRELLRESASEIEAAGEAEVEIAGRSFRIRKEFLDDLDEHQMRDVIHRLKRALLIFHGPHDRVVGIDSATRIFTAALHPKSFISLDDADHLLSRRADAAYVATVLAAWASRYVGTAGEPSEQPEGATAPPRQVVVSESGEGTYAQIIRVGPHRLRADEPAGAGGDDTGPSPYDLLLAALGSCTSMTIRMYADRKEWPVERIAVRLTHEKIHAQDCEDCETKEGKIDRIERFISIEGELGEDQRQKLLEIASKCPVHRTLQSETSIATRLE